MKLLKLVALGFAATLAFGSAFAVPSGKTVEFAGGGEGKVVFEGKVHKDKGLKCNDCHKSPKLFEKEAGADKIKMSDMKAGKFCGACHDGKKAFATDDKANCTKCHKK